MDAYTAPLAQVEGMARELGIDPAKFTEHTLRRMVATRLRKGARRPAA